jgi:hypothetical protein
MLGAALVGALAAPAGSLAVASAVADDTVLTNEDVVATGNVLANDTGMVRVAAVVNYVHAGGTLDVAADGAFTFTPTANWSGGPIVTTYWGDPDATVNGNELLAYVRVTVTAVNDAPVATTQSVSTNEDTAKAITLAGTDVEGSVLSYAIVSQPAHGTMTGSGADRTYTPNSNWYGQDSFTFKVNDGSVDSAPATVSVEVVATEDIPVANAQAVSVVFDTPKAITLTGSDADEDHLDFVIVAGPAHGSLSGTAPAVTYTPAAGYTGTDAFTFKVNDGNDDSSTATVSITVAADAVPPVIDSLAVAFGTGRVNETAPLRISWSGHDAGVGLTGYEVQAQAGSGPWTTISTGTAVAVTKFSAFSTDMRWRVRAKDANDNWSGWTESATRRLTAYQGASPIAFTGTWAKVTSSGSSGTGYRYTATSGKKVRLTFTGLGVMYVAPKLSAGGYARVKIDAAASTRVSLRASRTSLGVIVKTKLWDTSGAHSIQVWNDQGGRRTTFDAFIVLR